jgi:hypothetical protein
VPPSIDRIQCGGHGFLVADFADQDAVRRLAQRVAQRRGEVFGVAADFALVDDRLLVLEEIFDRVFQGKDVARAQFVSVVQHRGDGGRLAGGGRADQQNQSALFHDQVRRHRRQLQIGQRWNGGADEAEYGGDGAALFEGGQAEASKFWDRHAHVQFIGGGQFVHLRGRDDFRQQRGDFLRLELLLIDRDEVAVDSDVYRRIHGEEHVRRVFFLHQLEQAVHGHGALLETWKRGTVGP